MTTAHAVTFALLGLLLIILAVIGYQAWLRSRITPEEQERLRRSQLVARGKMGDATVVEIRDHLVFYSYDVRGMEYTASQDISMLTAYMPTDFTVAIGPVFVKYDARNPANSIVLSEEWSGLRVNQPRA
ncbi:MAG TPA: hypothetical protein VG675_15020 [Bryobacteraceae bacterium]|nr:hypothetical protein [Bryobacteraceae bacterium]